MEKITFSYPHFTGGYGCSKPNVETDDYYRASDVDAMLADVARLVDVSKKFNEIGWTQRGWEDLMQKQNEAIAAVEARMGVKKTA